FELAAIDRAPVESQGSFFPIKGRANKQDIFEMAAGLSADGNIIQIAQSITERSKMLTLLSRFFLAITIPAIFIGLFGRLFLEGKALASVRDLLARLKNIVSAGDLTRRLALPQTADELDELSALFNGLLSRIEKLVNGMKSSLDNVAHELRTPMT